MSQKEPGKLARYLKRVTTIRDRSSKLEAFILAVSCILVVLGIWQFVSGDFGGKRLVDRYTLPSPKETLDTFGVLWNERALARSILWSLGRVFIGFLAGAAIAIPLGVISGCYLRVNDFVQPLSNFGRSIPIAALIPLTMMWFGIGELQKVMFILIASITFVLFDTTRSVQGISNRFLDTAYTLGARKQRKRGAISAAIIALFYALFLACMFPLTKSIEAGTISSTAFFNELAKGSTVTHAIIGWIIGFLLWYPIRSNQVINKVMFPLALPDVVNSMRLLFGLGFGYIILAEVIDAKYGLGRIIQISSRQGPREHIYLCLIIIGVLAYSIDRIVYYLQRRWFPYRQLQ